MVRGIELFRDYFAGHEDKYTIIGGTACDLLMEDAYQRLPVQQNGKSPLSSRSSAGSLRDPRTCSYGVIRGFCSWRFEQESNPYQQYRKLLSYPLNDRSE